MRVLLIEDHAKLATALASGLRRQGMAVDVVFDGRDGIYRATTGAYDVVVLDRDLPKVHGDEVCRTLVREGLISRVLMLTAASSVDDRVEGLGLGADDYLAKPFAFSELVARIRALGRRATAPLPPVGSVSNSV
jgi:DNA-binding response OmpR family regulator